MNERARAVAGQGFVHDAKLRVRYAETDQMGVVYHSNYIVWFEVGRVEFLRVLGFTYREMEKEGTRLAVADVRCRYKVPAHYDDLLRIRTRLLKVRGSLVHFGYEVVRDADHTLLATGESTHLVIDLGMNRATLPPKYLASLRSASGNNVTAG
jgi:acyl-CoA thioester hydrolase